MIDGRRKCVQGVRLKSELGPGRAIVAIVLKLLEVLVITELHKESEQHVQ